MKKSAMSRLMSKIRKGQKLTGADKKAAQRQAAKARRIRFKLGQ